MSIRVRPRNSKDIGAQAWECNDAEGWIRSIEGEEGAFTGKEKFKFNHVLDAPEHNTQRCVYDKVAATVVRKVMAGYNGA